jgi:adenylate cyclase
MNTSQTIDPIDIAALIDWPLGADHKPRCDIRREFVAVVACDVASYGRLIELDDLDTVLRIRVLRRQLIEPAAAFYRSRSVRYSGDSTLMTFSRSASAVLCALVIQRGLRLFGRGVPEERRIRLRMGISLDHALVIDGDLHGPGVNIASRLEALAEPGDIYVSGSVFDQIERSGVIRCEPLGERQLKNIERPVRVYRVARDQLARWPSDARPEPDRPTACDT